MKRILSYSLFKHASPCRFKNHAPGILPLYWQTLPALVRANAHLYPGWEFRIYHDSSIDDAISGQLRRYRDAGLVTCVYAEESTDCCRSMLWRLRPLWEDDVEYMLCRDMDSLSVHRERQMVEAFIQSRLPLHCINDHFKHTHYMMGCGVGFHVPAARQRVDFFSWEQFAAQPVPDHGRRGWDQVLMDQELYPRLFPNVCAHRIHGRVCEPGVAQCSTTVPDVQVPGVPNRLAGTNDLSPFIGAPRFDVSRAVQWFDQHGDAGIISRIKEAEKTCTP